MHWKLTLQVCLSVRNYYNHFNYKQIRSPAGSHIYFCKLTHFCICQVPFLDATNTLLYPIIPLTAVDYEEFGYPGDINDFHAIRDYSPYDNIQKDVLYPAVLISSSFNTR